MQKSINYMQIYFKCKQEDLIQTGWFKEVILRFPVTLTTSFTRKLQNKVFMHYKYIEILPIPIFFWSKLQPTIILGESIERGGERERERERQIDR